MPGKDKLESIVDQQAIENELSAVEKRLLNLRAQIDDINSRGTNIKVTSVGDVSKLQQQYNTDLKESNKIRQDLLKTAILEEKHRIAEANALRAEAQLRLANERSIKAEQAAIEKRNKAAQDYQNSLNNKLDAARAGVTNDVPFTNNTGNGGSNPMLTGPVVSPEELAATEEQRLATEAYAKAQRDLNDAKEEGIGSGKSIVDEYVLELTPLEAAVTARNKLLNTNESLKKGQKEDLLLLKSGTIDRVEYNKRIVESNAVIETNKTKITDLNKEIKAQAILQKAQTGSVDQLRARLVLLTLQYDRLTQAEQKSSKGIAIANETKVIANQIDIQQQKLGNYTKQVGNYFNSAYGAIRKVAQILPGIGIAGIFGLLFEGILKGVEALGIFETNAVKTGRAIDTLRGVSGATQKELKGMGSTAKEIAETSFKELEAATKGINTELGLSPSLIEKGEAALKLLKNETDDYLNTIAEGQRKGFFKLILNPFETGEVIRAGVLVKGNIKLLKEQTEAIAALSYAQEQQQFKAQDDALFKKKQQQLKDEQAFNDLQASNATDAFKTREHTLDANFKLENELITNQHKKALKESVNNYAKEIEADAEFHSATYNAQKKYLAAIEKLEQEKRERLRKATQEERENELTDTISRNQKVEDDEKELGDVRINALRRVTQAQSDLFDSQEAGELAKTQQTEKEKEAIRQKYDTKRTNFAEQQAKKLFAIQVSLVQRELSLFEVVAAELKKVTDHNLTPKDKQISSANFDEFVDVIKRGGKEADDVLNKLQFTGDKTAQMLSHLFEFKGKTASDVDEYVAVINKMSSSLKELGKEVLGGVFDIFINQIEKQKNAIQDLIDHIDRQKEADTALATRTIGNAQERADAIAVINADAAAKKEALERKQRQLEQKQAGYEKQRQIAEIIGNTAQAVTAALGAKPWKPTNIALAAVIGAIGAVQIARLIATPIPRYKQGTGSGTHPGGPMEVGDGGRSEGILFPDGTLMKSAAHSEVLDAPAGTKVFPDWNQLIRALPNSKGAKQVDPTKAIQKIGKDIVSAIKGQPKVSIRTSGRYEEMTQTGSTYMKKMNL